MFTQPSHAELGDRRATAATGFLLVAVALAAVLLLGPFETIGDRLPLAALVAGSVAAGAAAGWRWRRFRPR
jgi:hypothetical protein